jgi:1,4-alpha-glucan branching enzyme
MGAEFGQWSEWNHSIGLEWYLLNKKPHKRLQLYLRNLNRLYRSERAFYEVDFKGAGFEWIYLDKADENVIAFTRRGKDTRNCLFFVMNFSPVPRENFRMGVPFPVFYKELLNSDATEYWGSGKVLHGGGVMAEEIPCNEHGFSLSLLLPPLGAVILRPLLPSDSRR